MLRDNARPVSRLSEFQVWLQCRSYHYILIWCCPSNYDSDIDVHILNLIEKMFFCQILYKYPIPLCGNLLQTDSFCRFLGDSFENLWKLSVEGQSPHQQIRRNYDALRSGSHVCYYLLYSFIQHRFPIKYVSYDSVKTLLFFGIAKND